MALITTQDVKTRTSIGGNVDGDRIMHLIEDAEVLVLENILGTKLYDKIVTDYNDNNPNNLAGDYLTLYNTYIIPILCYLVHAEFLRDNIVLSQNSGIFTHTPEDAQPSNLDNIKYVAKASRSKADAFIERMYRFLCDVDISEYTSTQDNNYDQSPGIFGVNSGWWFGSVPRKKTYTSRGDAGDYIELE